MPVTVGIGGSVLVSEGLGTVTSSERHTPSGLMTVVTFDEEQASEEGTHDPERRTRSFAFEQDIQLDEPGPEQLPQELSQVLHAFALASQYSFFAHVDMHRPLLRTGRSGGQDVHWLNEDPEQVAQSGWQERQEEVEGDAKVDLGQEEAERHFPLKESWP